MARSVNAVLYACAAGMPPRPISSVTIKDTKGKSEKNGALKFAHASTEEFRDCKARGVPFPEIRAMQESREADESGKTTAEYLEVDPLTLAPITGAKKSVDLDGALNPTKGE